MWLISDEIGFSSIVASAPPENSAADSLVDERIGDAFVVAERSHRTAGHVLALLDRGQYRFRHAHRGARQGLAFELGEGGDARDLLDQIGLAHHVRPPGRHMRHVIFQPEAERLSVRRCSSAGIIHADERLHPVGVELVGAVGVRHLARRHHVRRLAAAEIEDHLGGQFDGGGVERRVDAALEAVARVGVDLERAAGLGDLDRVPDAASRKTLVVSSVQPVRSRP